MRRNRVIRVIRKRCFSLIEVLLAVVVLALGVIALMGLFPIGLKASRDAMAETYAADAALQFSEYIRFRATTDANGWATTRAMFPTTQPSPADLADWSVDGAAGMPGTLGRIHQHSSRTGVFKIVSFVDSNNNLVPDIDSDIIDFQAILAVWVEQIQAGGSTLPLDAGGRVIVEISWPAAAVYNNREKVRYYMEVFDQ